MLAHIGRQKRARKRSVMIKKNPTTKPLPQRADGSSAPLLRLGTVREACTYGLFSHTKCYDYINSGRIDAYKRDGRTFIDLDSIDAMHAAVLTKIVPTEKPSL
jgi:hypothetical protein